MRRALLVLVGMTVTIVLTALAMVLTSAPAAANVHGPCEVRIGDHDVRGRNSTSVDDAVRVPNRRSQQIHTTSSNEIRRYRVQMELAGVRWTAGTGTADGFLWSRGIRIREYTWLGVGLFRLRVSTEVEGGRCLAKTLIRITGRHPLTTVAGAGGSLAALAGLAAAGSILLRGAGPRLRTRRTFEASVPLRQFDEVETPGDYVGWAEVACHRGARRFLDGTASVEDVNEFVRQPATRQRLSALRARGARVDAESDHLFPRLRWRPRLFVLGPLGALAGALGVLLLLQQFAVVFPHRPLVLGTAAITLGAALVLSNLFRLLAVAGLNRRLARAESDLAEPDEAHEPWYPPPDDLDTYAFSPTHVVPEGGLPAWAEPDREQSTVAQLDAGLPVRVTETRDGLAQILCSNGWVGWTEHAPLEELDRSQA